MKLATLVVSLACLWPLVGGRAADRVFETHAADDGWLDDVEEGEQLARASGRALLVVFR